MSKSFMGPRLKRLREERGLTQVVVARNLDVSASYYNQLENNQRPLTSALLIKVAVLFGVNEQFFSEGEEARLISDMREALAAAAPEEIVTTAELKQVASQLPSVARALVTIQRRHRQAAEQAEAVARRLNDAGTDLKAALPPMPYEEVRDFFYARHNYIAPLDELAEKIAAECGLQPGQALGGLMTRLQQKHGVQIVRASSDEGDTLNQRRYLPERRELRLALHLTPGQAAFQIATQLAFLEGHQLLDEITLGASFSSAEARALSRVGLAHHFAGALIMPYGQYLAAAEEVGYDIDRLCQLFGVGYETACHRLSTLQRSDALGVPFFFMRVDRAGNISKRQSATDFHFSRVGGTCPLWNVYEAFAQPGRVLVQLAQMPDGRTYLWIARTVTHGKRAFGAPEKMFAIGLGCDATHAHRLVYSRGLDLKDLSTAIPIGMGCKVCDRPACPQRAFPPVGSQLAVDENESRYEPYPVRGRSF